jgi:hypothetical protein
MAACISAAMMLIALAFASYSLFCAGVTFFTVSRSWVMLISTLAT